ncbi:MAG: hypothetical protein GF353_03325 [Candidatus Lokiarchaeota archaeon]|nr:hypothetical protein [Candidatus Lokiarchaeota archaeon]
MRKPPILNFASPMNASNQQKPFFYDKDSSLNIIEINGSLTPFVEVPAISTPELYTKTEADREKDEDSLELLELETKTLVRREDEDEDFRLIELYTKTKIQREGDDE